MHKVTAYDFGTQPGGFISFLTRGDKQEIHLSKRERFLPNFSRLFNELITALKHPKCKLTSLDLTDNSISSEGAKILAEALQHPSCQLTSLVLDRNSIGAGGLEALAEALQSPNCKLASLNLARNSIGDEGGKALAESLQHPNCQLTSLNLCWSSIGDEGGKNLVESLQHPNCKLTSLNLCESGIGNETVKILAETLQHPNCKLTSLKLHDNNITDEGLQLLVKPLQHPNCKLKSLGLGWNKIGSTGAKILAETLKHSNCKLRSLVLDSNYTGVEGVMAVAEALQHPNCKLISLNLGRTAMPKLAREPAVACREDGDQVVIEPPADGEIALLNEYLKALTEALQHPNCKLTSLQLVGNNIRDDGVKALAELLQHPNCKLTSLDLGWNKIGSAGAKILAETLKHPNCKLTSLSFQGNEGIGTLGATALARALQHRNCKLTSLDLYFTHIGVEGARALAEALQHPSCKLALLDLRGNKLDDEGAKALAIAIESNINITRSPFKNTYFNHLLRRNQKIQKLLKDVGLANNAEEELRQIIDSEPKVTGWGRVYIEAITGLKSVEGSEDEKRWITAINTILQSDDWVIDLRLSQAIEDLVMRMKRSEPKKEIEALAYLCATPNIECHLVAVELPFYLCVLIERQQSSTHGDVGMFSAASQSPEIKQVDIPEALYFIMQDGLSDWIEAVNDLEDSPANDAFKEALTELLSHVLQAQKSIGIAESRQMVALQGLTMLEGLDSLEPPAHGADHQP